MRRLAALGAAVAVLLAGCSGEGEGNASPTLPSSASTTSTTTAPDVSVIPEVIDEAYLDAVLAALDEVEGEAARIIVATKRLPPDAVDRLNAIYSDEEFQFQIETWVSAFAKDPQLSSIKPVPANRRTTVRRIITASPDCVWMEVERDDSESSAVPVTPRTEYVALRPLDRSNDPRKFNPTAWMIGVEGFNEDGSEPGNQCDES